MTIHRATIRNWSSALLMAAMLSTAVTGTRAEDATNSNVVSTTATVDGATHLVVGRSMFINTLNRLRRVYVSNPAVLDSFTASPHQIVVTAKSPGVSSLILWDETGQSQVYVIDSDIDVSDLRHALKDALPYENVRADGREEQVALVGTVSNPQAAAAAVKLAGMFSKSVADSLQIAPQHARCLDSPAC
jgi:pilus assembly protein CpaC